MMPKWLNACPASDPAIRRVDSLRKQLAARLDDVALRVEIARRYFDLAMAQGDPRYVGYASAALAPLAKNQPRQRGLRRLRDGARVDSTVQSRV